MSIGPEPLSGVKLYFNSGSIPFWVVHVAALGGVVALGFSWWGLVMAVALYYARMFFLTAGYHRYFAHRSYSTSRAFQLVLAVMGQTCAQMGALWWAANHRAHHRHSDQTADVHSPVQHGFWWSHLGWFMDGQHEGTNVSKVRDFAKYPELVWLNDRRFALLPPVVLALGLWALGGLHALVWGFFVSTVLLWHGTFTINSLAHLFGSRRYITRDDSRNNFWLALITMGEGWHNNHHHYQSAVRQGFFWWELDATYYILRGLARLGLIWDLREPPHSVVHPKQGLSRDGKRAGDFPDASGRSDTAA
jgi:stearoyl-CoA desaturase (delta-9 desaturase)